VKSVSSSFCLLCNYVTTMHGHQNIKFPCIIQHFKYLVFCACMYNQVDTKDTANGLLRNLMHILPRS
jgi:hypothetical protein